MNKVKTFVGISLVLLMFLSINAVTTSGHPTATKSGDTVSVSTDTLAVNIQGGSNVPAFTFYSKADSSRTYRLQLDSIFEAIDKNGNGVYDLQTEQPVPQSSIALAALSWTFSSFDTVKDINGNTTAINFNVTSTAGIGLNTSATLQFRFHLNASNPSQMKFDVVIHNYTFKDANAMLVIAYKLITAKSGDSSATENNNQVNFGNGYIKGNDTAQSGNQTIQAGISNGVDTGSPKIYLSYAHFQNDLVQDPIIGISNTVNTGNNSSTTSGQNLVKKQILPKLPKGMLPATSILATMIFLAVPVLIYKSKKNN